MCGGGGGRGISEGEGREIEKDRCGEVSRKSQIYERGRRNIIISHETGLGGYFVQTMRHNEELMQCEHIVNKLIHIYITSRI